MEINSLTVTIMGPDLADIARQADRLSAAAAKQLNAEIDALLESGGEVMQADELADDMSIAIRFTDEASAIFMSYGIEF